MNEDKARQIVTTRAIVLKQEITSLEEKIDAARKELAHIEAVLSIWSSGVGAALAALLESLPGDERSGARPRGVCAVCRREVSITKIGQTFTHYIKGQYPGECPGSGQPPYAGADAIGVESADEAPRS